MSLESSFIVSAPELFEQLNNPQLIILDASIPPVGNMKKPQAGWPNVIIPNARRFDIESEFSDQSSPLPHTLPTPADFELACQKLGINQDSQIVVYDNLGIFSSARAWYMLKAMGLKQVAVLNGGLPAWQQQGFLIAQATDRKPWSTGNFKQSFDSSYFCRADYVHTHLNSSKVNVLDARSFERFTGDVAEPRAGVRSGHIPQSLSFPYSELLRNGHLKDLSALKTIYEKQSIPTDGELIMSCGSGITACILALSAELIGHENITVYDGSWSDWGSDYQRPIETGGK